MEPDKAAAKESEGNLNDCTEKNSGSEQIRLNEKRRDQAATGAVRHLGRDKEKAGELEV